MRDAEYTSRADGASATASAAQNRRVRSFTKNDRPGCGTLDAKRMLSAVRTPGSEIRHRKVVDDKLRCQTRQDIVGHANIGRCVA